MDEALTQQTRASYNVVAESYARVLPDTSYEAPLDLAMVRQFVDELAGQSSARVLDAGCGAGRMMTYLRSLDASLSITGVDLSPAMVDIARSAHPSVPVREGDVMALPFDGEEFNGILAWYSIIHIPPVDLASAIAEFCRVLRPGGLLLVAFQSGAGERRIRKPYGHDVELQAFLHSSTHVEATLYKAGFTRNTRLERSARSSERHDQAFILAQRS